MTSRQIRVAIIENHQLVSESLGLLLDGREGMTVVGTASSVSEAAALAGSVALDVVVMDFHLPDGTGRDAAIAMRNGSPDARFVFLSRDGGDDARLAAIEAGAAAYILKSEPAANVIEAVRNAANGINMITPNAIARLVSSGDNRRHIRASLSPREREVLQLMSEGVSTHGIASQLGVGYSTVRTHIRSISHKLGAKSMLHAVVTARELELVN